MTDILEELDRAIADMPQWQREIVKRASDEIERLRAALADFLDGVTDAVVYADRINVIERAVAFGKSGSDEALNELCCAIARLMAHR